MKQKFMHILNNLTEIFSKFNSKKFDKIIQFMHILSLSWYFGIIDDYKKCLIISPYKSIKDNIFLFFCS